MRTMVPILRGSVVFCVVIVVPCRWSPGSRPQDARKFLSHYIVQRSCESIARSPPGLNIGEGEGGGHAGGRRSRLLVSHVIPPVVQVPQMRDPLRIPWGRPVKVEQEAEALEVLADVLDGRVPGVERESGRELALDRGSHGGRNRRGAQLGALRVKVPTITLEMPADEHHVALEAFLG